MDAADDAQGSLDPAELPPGQGHVEACDEEEDLGKQHVCGPSYGGPLSHPANTSYSVPVLGSVT